MSDGTHQQQLWIRIGQIMQADRTREWTPEALAGELKIPVRSGGYQRILEVLEEASIEQARPIKFRMGFV
jgi:hypothetical protein